MRCSEATRACRRSDDALQTLLTYEKVINLVLDPGVPAKAVDFYSIPTALVVMLP